jgi:hypothetical protein
VSQPICRQCGEREVEPGREDYATPVCFACLPPPAPLPVRHLAGCALDPIHRGACFVHRDSRMVSPIGDSPPLSSDADTRGGR